ncbi:probable RNA-directed DNA polymerase from transposon BS isoform X2 [Antennarius striatus]|uniref:probable RNA-directed DNA polymerase from transposon BS isoform X2 n=1 Tax=Antennarius striatus TaxID=241820 RepID=UPI0035B18A2F
MTPSPLPYIQPSPTWRSKTRTPECCSSTSAQHSTQSSPSSSSINDFLKGRPQAVQVSNNTSSTITLNSGAPQGCVLSPLLFTLLTHDCTPTSRSNLFIKFADDMTVVGLFNNNDETAYRNEVSRLAMWCKDNNLHLNVEKTKDIVVDFRRTLTQHAPLTIDGAAVERVNSTKFLGVHISEDLSWDCNTALLAKKAQQRLYFLRKLRRVRPQPLIMLTFYRGTIESILTSCITVWCGACTVSCRKTLQRIVRAAEKITGVSLPSLIDIYNPRLTRKAISIAGCYRVFGWAAVLGRCNT